LKDVEIIENSNLNRFGVNLASRIVNLNNPMFSIKVILAWRTILRNKTLAYSQRSTLFHWINCAIFIASFHRFLNGHSAKPRNLEKRQMDYKVTGCIGLHGRPTIL
jgi:hypothetical protein